MVVLRKNLELTQQIASGGERILPEEDNNSQFTFSKIAMLHNNIVDQYITAFLCASEQMFVHYCLNCVVCSILYKSDI